MGALADLARRLGARWYVFGAQAAVVWGRPRMTADVDATIELETSDLGELLDAASRTGLEPREEHAEQIALDTRVVPLVLAKRSLPVDLIIAGSGLEVRFLDRARMVAFGVRKFPLISPEDLVLTKLIAGRPRDLEDVRGILTEQGKKLDFPYIEASLDEIEEVLERGTLSATLRQLRREAEGSP
jgi:hypothetical protein